jgi:hypothetical protein
VAPVVDRCRSLRRHLATGIALAAIVGIPLAFTVVTHGDWLLDFAGEDNWIYIKYFFIWDSPHPELRQMMDLNYKATRVPWILPGYAAYKLFGPLLATYILHLTVLIGGAICFWGGARRLFGDVVALVTTLLLLAYPGFHGSGITLFWNYHGQAALDYYYVATLGAIIAATSRYALLGYALAGAGLVSCLGTTLSFIVMMPAFGVFALAIQPRIDARRIAMMLAGGLVGAAVAIALFGTANVIVGGPFLFVWRQITYTFEVTADLGWTPFEIWFPSWFHAAYWLGLSPLVAIVSLVVSVPLLRSTKPDGRRRLILGCWLQLLVAWTTLIWVEMRGDPLMEIAHHYHMMMGPTAYALAALIWAGLRLDRRPLYGSSALALAVGLVAPQVILRPELRSSIREALDPSKLLPVLPSDFWGTAILLLASGWLLVAALRDGRAWLVGAAGITAGIAFATTAVTPGAYLPPDRCSFIANQYRVVQQAVFWSTVEHIDTRALIWYDPEESRPRADNCPPIQMYPIFDAIEHGSAIHLAATPSPRQLAEINPNVMATAARNRWSLVLLSTPEAADQSVDALQTWLDQAHVRAVARPHQRFEAVDGDVAVVLQVFNLRPP